MARTQLANARWSTAYKNSLPDSAFLYVDTSCVHRRDRQGRSHPLNCRHFPYKDRAGRVDLKHVRNAIGRAPQSKLPLKVVREVQAEARRVLARHGGYEREPELQETYTMAANASIRIPKMPRWKQISGDMDPGKYGAVIARSDGNALELVEIQPVRELVGDGEAEEVGFPFWSKEAYYDLDDLSPSKEDVRFALQYTGAADELDEMDPEQRALAIAESLLRSGYGTDEGPAGWSSDVVPGEVEWWAGVGGPEFIADEDDEFRTDILGEGDDEDDEEFESNPARSLERELEAAELRLQRAQRALNDYPVRKESSPSGEFERIRPTARDLAKVKRLESEANAALAEVRRINKALRQRQRRNPGRSSQHLERSSFMGKFDSGLDEMVYGISLDGGGDEEIGDADALGFALIMRNGPEIADAIAQQPLSLHRAMTRDERDFLHEEGRAGVIVFVNSQGFVQVVYYDDARELEQDWSEAVEELSIDEEY